MTRSLSRGHALAVGCLVVAACTGPDSVSNRGSTGGKYNTPFSCTSKPLPDWDNAWTNEGITGKRTAPNKCPFFVEDETSVPFGAVIVAPMGTTPFEGGADIDVFSVYDGMEVVPYQQQMYEDDPDGSDNRTVQFTGNYEAGHVWPAVSLEHPWSHDSGTVHADTFYGSAAASITLSAGDRLLGAKPDSLVPGTPATGSPMPIRAVTEVDTNAYDFAWRVDGVDIAYNDAVLPYTFSLPGDHDVTAFAQYLTGVDTIHATVHVGIQVSIDGPQSISPYVYTTWTANGPTGYAPYTYQWYIDGNPTDTGPSTGTTFTPSSTHDISVAVWDSHGYFAQSDISVIVNTGSCPPDDPGCAETDRHAKPIKVAPVAPKPKKPPVMVKPPARR